MTRWPSTARQISEFDLEDELADEIRGLRTALSRTSDVAETACERLARYQPVIDAARAAMDVWETHRDYKGWRAAWRQLRDALETLSKRSPAA